MSSNYHDRERGFDRDDDRDSGGRRGGRGGGGGGGGAMGGRGGAAGGGARRMHRRKVCHFCRDKVDIIDWKDAKFLQSYIPERGKILPRRISGSCATHQRMLAEAIKRARNIALIPYATA